MAKLFYAAVYIRLSREDGDKEESDSVGNQRKLLSEYVSKIKDLIVYDTYVDDGCTGTNFNRPGFQRMIADIEEGKVNCVVVKDLSRFGRDYIDTGRYLERIFPELGIRFISVTDGIDSIRQAYDMLLPIKNIFNEQYARDISKKIQATVKSKQKAGEFIGSFTSYGYQKSPADKNKLIIDEYAAGVVRKIFRYYVGGMSKQSIAKHLNAQGILCPSEYKRANGQNYKNSRRLEHTSYWTYSTIHAMLKNEMYIGNMVQGKKHQQMRGRQKLVEKENWTIVKGTHAPIIDRETWEKTQKLLSIKRKDMDMETNKNIFAGFIICGDCGRAMVKSSWKRADGTCVSSFYCGTYKRQGSEYCTPHALPLHVLEDIVRKDLKAVLQNAGDLKKLVERQSFLHFDSEDLARKEFIRVKGKLQRVQKLKKSVYEDYKEGLISKEEFLDFREDYLKKEELYQRQAGRLEEHRREYACNDIYEIPWIKKLLEMKDIENLDRNIVVEMIDKVIVYKNNKIKIRYNFMDKFENDNFYED